MTLPYTENVSQRDTFHWSNWGGVDELKLKELIKLHKQWFGDSPTKLDALPKEQWVQWIEVDGAPVTMMRMFRRKSGFAGIEEVPVLTVACMCTDERGKRRRGYASKNLELALKRLLTQQSNTKMIITADFVPEIDHILERSLSIIDGINFLSRPEEHRLLGKLYRDKIQFGKGDDDTIDTVAINSHNPKAGVTELRYWYPNNGIALNISYSELKLFFNHCLEKKDVERLDDFWLIATNRGCWGEILSKVGLSDQDMLGEPYAITNRVAYLIQFTRDCLK